MEEIIFFENYYSDLLKEKFGIVYEYCLVKNQVDISEIINFIDNNVPVVAGIDTYIVTGVIII